MHLGWKKVYTAVLSSRSIRTNDIKFSKGRLSEGKGRQTPSFNICWLPVEKEEALVHLCVLYPLSSLIQSSDEQDSHIGHAGADSHSRNAQVIRWLQRGKGCHVEDATLIERAPVVVVVTVILATSGWLSDNVPGSPLRRGHQAERPCQAEPCLVLEQCQSGPAPGRDSELGKQGGSRWPEGDSLSFGYPVS